MAVSRKLDFGIASGMPSALAILVLIKGDPLYMGLWYYLAVFLVLLVLGAALRPRPLFLTGASLALSFTFLAYMAVNMLADRPEGLLGLGHLFSLPGALIGTLVGTVLLARRPGAGAGKGFAMGLAGLGGGFLANQWLVCQTLMWCGPLSLPFR